MTQDFNREIIISNYIVAFIDLLGQSAELSRYLIMPSEEIPDFIQWRKTTFGVVYALKAMIEEMLNIIRKSPSFVRDILKFHKENINIKSISDSFLIYSSLHENKMEQRLPILDVHTIIITCGLLITCMLASGKPFRAAIEIGVGIDDDEYGFYGSAISNAYKIESKIADFPRILIGPLLYEYITVCSTFPESLLLGKHRFSNKLIVETSKNLLNMLIPIDEKYYMLDFLGNYFLDIFQNVGMKYCAAQAYDQVINSYNYFKTEKPSTKLYKRYEKLKLYFESKITNWLK